jgi:ligand-binding sensor domain-containing protein
MTVPTAILRANLLFLLLLGVTICKGQDKDKLKKSSVLTAKTDTGKSATIVRKQGAASGSFSCDLQDKSGRMWFGSGGEGVFMYDGQSFQNFTTEDGLLDNDVNGIAEDKKGNILFGTRKGICRYDGTSIQYLTQDSDESRQAISSLLVDKTGHIWFGTWNNGVYRYDGKAYTNFLNKGAFNLKNSNQLILDILEDKDGKLWFSSWNGGGVWQYDGQSFQNFLPNAAYYKSGEDARNVNAFKPNYGYNNVVQPEGYERISNTISDDMIFSMVEDKAGNIWFATRRHGACRYDGKHFTSFRENEGFVSYGITAILESKNGLIWLSTDKNGVYVYDGKIFKNFTESDGLVYNSVTSMIEDKNGNIWMATRAFGLSRYDGKIFTTVSAVKQ